MSLIPRRAAALAATAFCLAACSHVPLATIAKLWSFDMAKADPAVLRAAVRLPPSLVPRPGGVVLTVTTGSGTAAKTTEIVLEEVREAEEMKLLSEHRRKDTELSAFRLSEADVKRVRLLQAEARSSGSGGGNIAISAKACRKGDLPKGAIVTSTYLRLDLANGYLPLIENIDLRAELKEADLDKEVPPC